jgi:putative membrane protein
MMGFSFGGFGIVYMLIFWVVIVGLAVWLLSSLFPRGTNNTSSHATTRQNEPLESPLEILQQRYARGEISKAEYEEMRRDLDV